MKLYLYAIAALAIAGLLFHDHLLSQRLKVKTAALAVATATITAERANTRRANDAEQKVVKELDDFRNRPLPPVPRLRCQAVRVPEGSGTAVAGEALEADDGQANGRDPVWFDPAPAAREYSVDAELNLIQCTNAIEFLEGLSR